MCLFWELPFKVIQTLQCFCHVLEFKETAGKTEMGLQVAWIQGYGLQAVSQSIIMVPIPEEKAGVG